MEELRLLCVARNKEGFSRYYELFSATFVEAAADTDTVTIDFDIPPRDTVNDIDAGQLAFVGHTIRHCSSHAQPLVRWGSEQTVTCEA